MLNSLRYRLLSWFIAFVLLIAGLMIPANLVYHSREKGITRVSQNINSLYVDFLKDAKSVNNFLTSQPDDIDFFFKGQSPYLSYHLRISEKMQSDLKVIRESKLFPSFEITGQLDRLTIQLQQYNYLIDSLTYLVYKRGYRNFGLEGELSDYRELLESAPGLTSRDIYRLRKIENDYFFSSDTSSVSSFNRLLTRLYAALAGNEHLSSNAREKTSDLINSYAGAFMRLVELDEQAGIRKNLALKASLNQAGEEIESLFTDISTASVVRQKALMNRLNTYYILALLLILSMALFFSYISSKHVVWHLETLTNYISVLAKNHLDAGQSIDLRNSAREIKQIYREFRNLLSQLKIWERQRDKALQNAEDNQQRYRELADMLPQSVFETDSFGNYTYVNKAWFSAFGYTPGELGDGLNLIETLISETNQDDILGQRKIENSNYIAIRKNGSKFPASVYTDNIIRDGQIAGRRGIIVDITDRIDYIKTLQQETSKARTSDELKSSFLANMSHEIRTPMNSIIGFSNLLASEQIPDNQKKDFTQYIRTSSELLLNLVDDIIDIAKIEAGELKIVKKDSDLLALGEELLTTSRETRKRFNKQHLELIFTPDPNCQEVFLRTDPFRLRQILVNLINNAIKFTEKGSVEFGFSVKDDSILEFFVKDTGVGLKREELDLIFERFKRARQSEEKNIVGTGLGLAISKNLVQLLGGEMWVDSVVGRGTTFLFTLPYLKPTLLPAGREENYQYETSYNWLGKTILIAEDDLNSYKFLRELLGKTRIEILHAPNGKKAVETVGSNKHIDLVIMDVQMPVMDGIEATRLIKEMNFSIPVIAQTAFAMAGDKEKMQQAGFDEYIAKPINSNQLLAIINHFLTQERIKGQYKISSAIPSGPQQ
ncbi:MAG: response regulator [Bacteroidales bacterium]|nr:response regulator [Bacteroidales bacterium]